MYATGLRGPSSILPILTDVFHWWTAQMRALLRGTQAASDRLPDALIVAVENPADAQPSGFLFMRKASVESLLQPIAATGGRPGAAAGLPVLLRLPRGMVLTRTVTLPLAAARDLHTVLAFEMNRLTPFAAEELIWGVFDVSPNRKLEKISLRLAIVLRSQVEPLLAALLRLSLTPQGIEADGGTIPLAAAGTQRRRRPGNLWGWICGLLAITCVILPFLRQQAALSAADRVIAAHSSSAQLGEAMRRQIGIANASRAAIALARRSGDALLVLAQLTDALPDGTWLNDLSLRAGDLTLDGQSDNAAKLISLLAAVPQLHGPSFTAPVTRSADNRTDQFSLHVSVSE
jgi:general secretion pathway protein L